MLQRAGTAALGSNWTSDGSSWMTATRDKAVICLWHFPTMRAALPVLYGAAWEVVRLIDWRQSRSKVSKGIRLRHQTWRKNDLLVLNPNP